MRPLSSTYSPALKMKRSVRKRTETIGLRVGFLALTLGVLALSSKFGAWDKNSVDSVHHDVIQYDMLSSTPRQLNERRSLGGDTSNFCETEEGIEFCEGEACFPPDGFPLACCRGFPGNFTDDTDCLAKHFLKECRFKDLCVAELIPGAGGGAECLEEFEQGGGGAVFYILILLYLFLGLAIVCDDYFTVALDKIADGLGVSEDVNGATFAAIGSSAPELFVSLADNVIAQPPKSVGIGTIVGSAIFNILIIIGASAIVAGKEFGSLKLNWRPISRDSFFYALSIILLIIVVSDEKVAFWEGIILMLGYVGYLTFMVYNQRIFNLVDKKIEERFPGMLASNEDAVVSTLNEEEEKADKEKGRGRTASLNSVGSAIGSYRTFERSNEDLSYWDNIMWPMVEPEEGEESNLTFTQRAFGGDLMLWAQRAYFILVFPLNLLFRLTIPDSSYDIFEEDILDKNGKMVKEEDRKKAYWFEFVMCIFHIAVFSHFLVFCAAKFGCIVGIPPAVMGLTILAAGTSVPDAITSIILAKNGKGDGAVANSIGSNVFDILIGLGLPWFLAGVIFGTDAQVATDDLNIAIGFLFGVLFILITALFLTKFNLNKFVGYFLVVLYGFYVLFELFIRPNV